MRLLKHSEPDLPVDAATASGKRARHMEDTWGFHPSVILRIIDGSPRC